MLACIQHTFPSFSLQPEKVGFFFPVLQTKIFQSNPLVFKRKKMLRLIMKQQIIAALVKTQPTFFLNTTETFQVYEW